jgi:hypothetical protein
MKKTESEFKVFKEAALKTEPLMRQANLADINIVDDKTISFNGKNFTATDMAINDFARIVGVQKTLMNNVGSAFGKGTSQKILEIQKAAKLIHGKNTTITLVANKTFGTIERILSGNSLLPYQNYFEVFERMMNGTNMEIVDFGSGSGGVHISTISRENEFSVGKHRDEVFHPGFTFKNDISSGAGLDSFLNRLICTNGMVGRGFSETVSYNPESINEFFTHLQTLKTSGFIPNAFNTKVASAMGTRASYAEVKTAANLITYGSKLEKQFVDKFVPYNDIRRKFAAKGVDTLNWNPQQMQNAITDVTVWDVINGVTDFASHDYGFDVSADNRLRMQVEAGKMLSREKFDTQNLVHISL